jgi:hypothetical protein
LYDRTPYDNHGALKGSPATGTSGIVGEAYTFDASDDFIDVDSPLSYSGTVTVTAWVRLNADWNASPSRRHLFSDDVIEVEHKRNSNIELHYKGTVIGDVNDSAYEFPEDEWELATLRYDGSTVELIKGTTVLDSASHSSSDSPTVSPRIGAEYNNSSRVWGGGVAEIRVYARALSDGELEALYNVRTKREHSSGLQRGLKGRWTMDDQDISSGTVYDASAYDNHGTIVGTPTTGISGKVGEAIEFGEYDYIQFDPDVNLPLEWTLSAWTVAENVADGDWNTLFRDGNHQVILHQSTGELGMYDTTNNVFIGTGYDGTQLEGGWHHLAVVGQGGQQEFYVDSVSVGTTSEQSTTSIDTIGNYDGYDQQWGKVDEVRLYDRAFSTDEINELYQKRTS